MKQGAIFDMDGLLFDTEKLYQETWVELAVSRGLKPHPDFPILICGSSGESALYAVRTCYPGIDPQGFIDECVEIIRQKLEKHVPVKPGVREILAFFRENDVKTAIGSSSRKTLVMNNLRKTGLIESFDAIITGDEVTVGKPDPAIFLMAAEQLGCSPKDCYVFEDGANGVKAGAAAGCSTVMIPDLIPATKELRALCTAVFPNLLDARDAIIQGELS